MTKFMLMCLEFELKESHHWQNASQSTAFSGRSVDHNVNYKMST